MIQNHFPVVRDFIQQYKNIIVPAACMVIAVAAGVVIRTLFLFTDEYATGFDGYYYALQVRSLFQNGEILNNDNSIVYPMLGFFSLFFHDYVFANKVAVIVLCSITVLPFFLVMYNLSKSSIVSLSASLFFTASYSQLYMSFEIVKNGVSILFIMSFFLCVLYSRKNKWMQLGAVCCFILGFMTHKVTAASMFVFLAVFVTLLIIVYRKELLKRLRPAHVIILAVIGVFVIVAIIFSLSTLRMVDIDNLLHQFSFKTVLKRFEMIVTETSDIRIKSELLLLYILPVLFIPFLIILLRNKKTSRYPKLFLAALFAAQLVLINPLLYFSWVSMSYRLVVMSIIFSAIELGLILKIIADKINRQGAFSLAGIVLVLGGITLPGMYTRFHSNRYPPYKELQASVMKLKDILPKGSRIVTHSGMSFFIWYETGIYTEHFVPGDNAGYYRLAYGIGPVHFRKYEHEPFYEKPVAIHPPYYLVKEQLWQMFYKERKDTIRLVKSWQNPYAQRPSFVYKVKEKFK